MKHGSGAEKKNQQARTLKCDRAGQGGVGVLFCVYAGQSYFMDQKAAFKRSRIDPFFSFPSHLAKSVVSLNTPRHFLSSFLSSTPSS